MFLLYIPSTVQILGQGHKIRVLRKGDKKILQTEILFPHCLVENGLKMTITGPKFIKRFFHAQLN